MRYRLLASYQDAPYEAGVGPEHTDVVLFAACPPPEELRFEPATGHWRKHVSRSSVQAIYESRPVGVFRGEPCVVLDDLTDRLHIAYLGHDAYRAEQLGYWEVDRGVFELITPRHEVTDIVEQRLPLEHPADAGLPGQAAGAGLAAPSGDARRSGGYPADVTLPEVDEPPLPLEAAALRAATATAYPADENGPAVSGAPGTEPAAQAALAGISAPMIGLAPDMHPVVPSWTPQQQVAHPTEPATPARPESGQASGSPDHGGPDHGGPDQTAPGSGLADGTVPAWMSRVPAATAPNGQIRPAAAAFVPAEAATGASVQRGPALAALPGTAVPGPTAATAAQRADQARPTAAPDRTRPSGTRPGGGVTAVATAGPVAPAAVPQPAPAPTPVPAPVPVAVPAAPPIPVAVSGPALAPVTPAPVPVAAPVPAAPPANPAPVATAGSAVALAPAAVDARAAHPRAAARDVVPAQPLVSGQAPLLTRRSARPAAAGAPAHPDLVLAPTALAGPDAPTGAITDRAEPVLGQAPQDPAADPAAMIFVAQAPPVPQAPVTVPAAAPVTAPAPGTVPAPVAVPQKQSPAAGPGPAASQPLAPVANSDLPAPDPAPRSGAGPAGIPSAEAERPRSRRSSRRRMPTHQIFSDLAAQAAIPPAAYSIGEEIDGAMCLIETDGGYEVFTSVAGARHEVRGFADEESAYFYLFGVLVAESVRTGALTPQEVAARPA